MGYAPTKELTSLPGALRPKNGHGQEQDPEKRRDEVCGRLAENSLSAPYNQAHTSSSANHLKWVISILTTVFVATAITWFCASFKPTLPAIIGTHRIADYCPQSDVLYPQVHYDVFEELVGSYYDSEAFKKYLVPLMSGAIQIPTESYDDMREVGQDERWDIFDEFHKYLRDNFPLIHSTLQLDTPNTYGLVYQWHGSDRSLAPILMTAHQDVVPVDNETLDEWTWPPYSGKYDDTFIWGRGSIDDKSSLIGLMVTIETLLEHGFQPARTIVIASGFDEESGGAYGAQYINEFLRGVYGENSFAMLVDEGGGYGNLLGSNFAVIGTGEKGFMNARIEVASPGGHSSVPPTHTSIGMLSAMIVEFEDHPFEPYLSRSNPIYSTIRCIAEYGSVSSEFRDLVEKSEHNDQALEELTNLLVNIDAARPYIETSQAATVIRGGVKANALPELAYAIVNHRISLDSSVAETQERDIYLLQPLAEKFNLNFTAFGKQISPRGEPAYGTLNLSNTLLLEPAPVTSPNTDYYRILSGSAKAAFYSHGDHEGELIASPAIPSANTDTKWYWDLTDNIFRYGHVNAGSNGELIAGIHTVNEAIRLEDLIEIIKFFTILLLNVDEATV